MSEDYDVRGEVGLAQDAYDTAVEALVYNQFTDEQTLSEAVSVLEEQNVFVEGLPDAGVGPMPPPNWSKQ
jgi:hypothetical protein